MNSLSYACPELLEGEDGLSGAVSAEEERDRKSTSSEQDLKDDNSTSSRSATKTPPPAYPSQKDARNDPLKFPDEKRSAHRALDLEAKVNIIYTARTYRAATDAEYEDAMNCHQDRPYKDCPCSMHRGILLSWDCGSCGAKLRYWRDRAEWEDGYCGGCGVLNRKVPEIWPPMVWPSVFENDRKVLDVWPPLDGKAKDKVCSILAGLGDGMAGTVG